jgi:spermidine synthase
VSAPRLVRQQGRRALSVDDVVQSIEVVPGELTPGYWPEMLPARLGARALLLGHGGGTVARLLLEVSADVAIHAVDDDAALLDLALSNPRFRIDEPRLTVERGDAFAAVRRMLEEGERFDYVAVDLYRGRELVRASLARPFLRRVNALLTANGWAVFNLPRDRTTRRRLRRLGQHLQLRGTRLIGLNCVVHCARLEE